MKYWEPIYSRVFCLPCTLTFHFLILRILELSTRFSIAIFLYLSCVLSIIILLLCKENADLICIRTQRSIGGMPCYCSLKKNIWHEIAPKHRLMHKFFRNYQGKHFWLNFLHLVNWFHIQGILHYHIIEFFLFFNDLSSTLIM